MVFQPTHVALQAKWVSGMNNLILMHLCLTVETYLIFIDSSPVHEIVHASALSQKQQPDYYVILGTINMFVWLTAIQSLMSTYGLSNQ